jgi:hypothetical protein
MIASSYIPIRECLPFVTRQCHFPFVTRNCKSYVDPYLNNADPRVTHVRIISRTI